MTVSILKNSSGLPWSDTNGLDISHETNDIYETYVIVCLQFASLITPYLCTDCVIRQTLKQACSKEPDSLTTAS